MNFWPFTKPEPAHVVPRFHAATREESLKVRRARASVNAQLAVYRAVTTPEQRKAEADAYFARASSPAELREGRG